MRTIVDFGGLKHNVITTMETEVGYLQVLEYVLQDNSYLHVVQWYFKNIKENNNNLPITNCQTFYKNKDKALEKAHEIGNNLLQQYLI